MPERGLVPWRPFRELERWARSFPSFFDDLEWPPMFERGDHAPAIESFVKNGNLVVRADMPGIDPKDIDISVLGNVLTIKGNRKEEKEVKEEDYFRRELSYGAFERRMTLPEGTNTDKVEAHFKNGVVEVVMPMSKEAQAKKIPIQVEAKK